jgi:hypothetical protein
MTAIIIIIIQIFISRAHTVRRRRLDFKLCFRNKIVCVAAGQALVAAITGEADRLLSLGDGSLLPGRADNKFWTRQYNSQKNRDTTHTLTRVSCAG